MVNSLLLLNKQMVTVKVTIADLHNQQYIILT